jgi:cell division protease FtsH
MSELGPLSFGSKDEPLFLGRDFNQRADYSEDTAIRIDREVDRIVQTAFERARKILTDNRAILERLAQELLEHESLDGIAVYATIREMTGKDLNPTPPEPASPEPQPGDEELATDPGTSGPAPIEEVGEDTLDMPTGTASTPSDPLPSTE